MSILTMDKVFIVFRYILCLLGAAALLYTFSYPDTLLPPNPVMEEAEGWSLYSIKPVIWVIPVLFMEIVCLAGPRKNLVWFSALFTVLAVALILYPLLAAYRPEYIEPTFPYQDDMLSKGLVYFVAFTGISVAVRIMLLAHMFPAEDLQDQIEVGYVSASALDPGKARTVREIAAEEKGPAPQFRFKAGDARLALRFKLVMKRMMMRSRMANAGLGAGILLIILWFALFPQPTAEEALQRDLKLMLQHRLTPQGYPLATRAAAHAAARVMLHISDHESFAGMSPEEAERWLGLDKLPGHLRAQLRDSRPIKVASANTMHEIRTRFFTITDGTHLCVLYVRTNDADGRIIISELQEAGWNAVADEARRRMNNDWGAFYR